MALSIGEGTDSRVYRTEGGGQTWTETFRNDEPRAFYDCLAFFDPRHGLAMSDPVDGRFRILATEDGGRSWRVLPSDGMPEALPGEAGFAASGQCLVTARRPGRVAGRRRLPAGPAVTQRGSGDQGRRRHLAARRRAASGVPVGVTWLPDPPFAAVAVGPSGSEPAPPSKCCLRGHGAARAAPAEVSGRRGDGTGC
ncbi:WD40/YVTN/BNR-like repeat-containing protein [Nonomuraea sp. 10N515B]|uniref:WD40/YVTN/BNR-like repeat-containing protein n=1 Tax=Nonomuraea sp. 10N515B TaxID=3457422 RepID=UPI003FCD8992